MAHWSDNLLLVEGPAGRVKELVELARSPYSDLDYRRLMAGPTDQEFLEAFDRNMERVLAIPASDTTLTQSEFDELQRELTEAADECRGLFGEQGVYALGSNELDMALHKLQRSFKPRPVRERVLGLLLKNYGFEPKRSLAYMLGIKEHELALDLDDLQAEGLVEIDGDYVKLVEDAVFKAPEPPVSLWPEPTSIWGYTHLAWGGELATHPYLDLDDWSPQGDTPLSELMESSKLTGKEGFVIYRFFCRHNRAATRLMRALWELFPDLHTTMVCIPEGNGTVWAGQYNPNYLEDGWEPETRGFWRYQLGYIPISWFLGYYKEAVDEGADETKSPALKFGKLLKRRKLWSLLKDSEVDETLAYRKKDDDHFLTLETTKESWPQEFATGRARLAALTDAQLMEAENLARLTEGLPVMVKDPSGIRADFERYLDEFEQGTADFSGLMEMATGEQSSFSSEAPSGWWQPELHRGPFCLAAAGVLQVMGLDAIGTNTPRWPDDMSLDYWPDEGLRGMPLSWPPFLKQRHDPEVKVSVDDLCNEGDNVLNRTWPHGGHPPEAL